MKRWIGLRWLERMAFAECKTFQTHYHSASGCDVVFFYSKIKNRLFRLICKWCFPWLQRRTWNDRIVVSKLQQVLASSNPHFFCLTSRLHMHNGDLQANSLNLSRHSNGSNKKCLDNSITMPMRRRKRQKKRIVVGLAILWTIFWRANFIFARAEILFEYEKRESVCVSHTFRFICTLSLSFSLRWPNVG